MQLKEIYTVFPFVLLIAGEALAHPGHDSETSFHHSEAYVLLPTLFIVALWVLTTILKRK